MIRGFETKRPLEPEQPGHFQWAAALGAGFISGLILLIVPRGNPWAGISFFAQTIMGRDIPASWGMSLFETSLAHLALGLIYGLIISVAVRRVAQLRALALGCVIGLLLYFINLGAVSLWLPMLRGSEVSVAVTHIIFGAISGGAYRGLLRRKPAENYANSVRDSNAAK